MTGNQNFLLRRHSRSHMMKEFQLPLANFSQMLVYIICTILLSTLFASGYKVAVHQKCNLQIVNMWVYIGATSTILTYSLFRGHIPFNLHACLLGVATGVAGYFATLTFFIHITRGQLSTSWTVISLSLAFPVMASILIWHEHPSPRQFAGFFLIVIALFCFGHHEMKNGDTQ